MLRGTKIKLNEEVIWVDFTYELLPAFCFYCGMIGHFEKTCEKIMIDFKKNIVCEGQYGEWLKTITYKGEREYDGEKMLRRVSEQKKSGWEDKEPRKEPNEMENGDEDQELERKSKNMIQDIIKEKESGRINCLENKLEEEVIKGIGVEKEEDQERIIILVSREDNRGIASRSGRGKGMERDQHLKGEVMEIDIGNQRERIATIPLQELNQNVMQIERKDKEEIKRAGQGKIEENIKRGKKR